MIRSKFWTFVEASDEAKSARAVKDLFASTMRELGFQSWALLTHAPPDELRSLSVVAHNWPPEAIAQLFAGQSGGSLNPLFSAVESTSDWVFWTSSKHRETLKKSHRVWFNRLSASLGGGEGISGAIRSTVVGASWTITSPTPLEPEGLRAVTRIANHAFQQIAFLQRPHLNETERLTSREHEFLYRATILGQKPGDVAGELGIKDTTVQSVRSKARTRLDAETPEQAAWRLLETGQLFRAGRKGRPRAR